MRWPVEVNGKPWTGADLAQTAHVIAALRQEASRAEERPVRLTPAADTTPVAWAVLSHLLTAPVPDPKTPEAVSWFWATHVLARERGSALIKPVTDRWPGLKTESDHGDLWSALLRWGLDPLCTLPTPARDVPLWELCCDHWAHPSQLVGDVRFPGPASLKWAQAHAPEAAQAFLVRKGWETIWQSTSSMEALDVYRRAEISLLNPEARDPAGTSLRWALVRQHPETLLLMGAHGKTGAFNFQNDRDGQGHDVWWAVLGAEGVQNRLTNKVLTCLKKLGTPEVGPEGKGWWVAHPEWVTHLTDYTQNLKGGLQTNHVVRRNLHTWMAKRPEVVWAGSETDHQAMVEKTWSQDAHRGARELMEWVRWMLPVPPDAPYVTPVLRGFFIQCLAASVGANKNEFNQSSSNWRDPDLWGDAQSRQAEERLRDHLALPHVLPTEAPLSEGWQALLQSGKSLAILRQLRTTTEAEPPAERRRSRLRS